jgi:Lamin Tail Domain
MRLVRSRLGGGLAIATVPIMAIALIACAKGADPIDLGDGAIVDDAGPGRDVVVIPDRDSGTGKDTGPGPEKEAGPCDGKVVINELMVDGTSEWVEIYNPSTCAVTVGGWRIAYRSKDDGAGGAGYTFAAGASLAPQQFFLIATSGFSGKKDATWTGGLGNAGGQLGLLDDTDKLIDGVGYNAGTIGLYVEDKPAVLPGADKSIGRSSDGVDTNKNQNDFVLFNSPTPGAPN